MTQRGIVLFTAAAIGLASTTGVTTTLVQAAGRTKKAEATLRTAAGAPVGTVEFRRRAAGTEVTATLKLPAGVTAMDAFHGFHVHANDKPENGSGCVADPAAPGTTWFVSADGHLKADGQAHGMHTGDLPSVLLNPDGTATLEFTDSRLDVATLAGRAVVLHAGADNFGTVPTGAAADQYTPNSGAATTKTADTGNAGDRIACGVITAK